MSDVQVFTIPAAATRLPRYVLWLRILAAFLASLFLQLIIIPEWSYYSWGAWNSIFVGVIFFVTTWVIWVIWRRPTRVALTETAVTLPTGKNSLKFPYSDIKEIVVWQTQNGQPKKLSLGKNWHYWLHLPEDAQSGTILAALQARLPQTTRITLAQTLPKWQQHRGILFVLAFIATFAGVPTLASWILAIPPNDAIFLAYSLSYLLLILALQNWFNNTVSVLVGIGCFLFFMMGLLSIADDLPRFWQHPCGFVGRYVQVSGCQRVLHDTDQFAYLSDDKQLRIMMRTGVVENRQSWRWANYVTALRLPHVNPWEKPAVAADGASVALNARPPAGPGKKLALLVWDVAKNDVRYTLPVEKVANLALSRDGRYLAFRADGKVQIWDTIQNIYYASVDADSVAFSPVADLFAAPFAGAIYLWELETGAEIGVLSAGMPLDLNNLAFSRDGRFLVASANFRPYVWDLAAGNPLPLDWPEGKRLRLTGTALSPDGRLLATLSMDEANALVDPTYLELWDLQTGTLQSRVNLTTWTYPGNLAFSPDGQSLSVQSRYDQTLIFQVAQMVQAR